MQALVGGCFLAIYLIHSSFTSGYWSTPPDAFRNCLTLGNELSRQAGQDLTTPVFVAAALPAMRVRSSAGSMLQRPAGLVNRITHYKLRAFLPLPVFFSS